MKKFISIILCAALLSSILVIASSAEGNEGIAPCLNNTSTANTGFVIEDGIGYVTISYEGYPGIATSATITTKIQKQFLFFFWTDVAEWVDEIEGSDYLGGHSTNITSKGTYKAVVKYVIRGTGGADDVFTSEVEYNYQ